MSGLAAANPIDTTGTINTTLRIFKEGNLMTGPEPRPLIDGYAAISGGALSVAGNSVVIGHVAAQAAVTIGAGAKLVGNDVSAGAAVTIGAGAKGGDIYAAAAAGVAADADVGNITARAAVTLGAPSDAKDITAGAAITMGAGSFAEDVQAAAAITGAVVKKDIYGNDVPGGNVYTMFANGIPVDPVLFETMDPFEISGAISAITDAQDTLSAHAELPETVTKSLGTYMGTNAIDDYLSGVYTGSALNIPADSTISFSGDAIINLSDALTLGANTIIDANGHSIIWNVGSALNLGAGTEFYGTAFVNGSVSGATADITCGSLYAKGAVAIGSVGKDCE
jgi:hypothetical protein